MGDRLTKKFQNRLENEGLLICYFPVGDPSFDSVRIASLYLKSGVDVLEIGIPVADPYLDGKIVADSMARALKDKSLDDCLDLIVKIREENPYAVLQGMVYKQLFDNLDWTKFNEFTVASDLDGLLVADATYVEQQEIRKRLNPNVPLLSFLPYNFNSDHLDYLNEYGEGYAFLQAVDGVTGMRESVDEKLKEKIQDAKTSLKKLPVCAGFGISTAEHVKVMKEMGADGVIIGSATLKKLADSEEALSEFIGECKHSLE